LWIGLPRLWRDWRSALAIVRPETVVSWHRAGFRLFWTWKVRRGQPGRLCLRELLSDANAFEISDLQEAENGSIASQAISM
jgi:hypothetical protein